LSLHKAADFQHEAVLILWWRQTELCPVSTFDRICDELVQVDLGNADW
jgi:hypothetical protein